jgi:hypothetical protein
MAMKDNVRYYVEMLNGERKPVAWHIAEAMVRLHNYVYVVREPNLEIVKKG